MLSFIKKKNYLLFLLSLIIFFSIHAIFQVFPEVRLGSRVLAIDSNGCEGGWTFNGGDAGDDSNWEYTGCEEDSGGGDDSDDDRDKWWEDDEDSDNTNYCDEDTWSNEETDGSYWCDNGRICFEQWGRDESCNIYRDGEDCRDDARCKQDQNNEESNNQCKYTYKYPECQADGQVYEVWQDCNGNWDPRPTGKSCSENEDQEDQQENQGSCAANEYWDTQSGKCVVNDLEQTKINDDIYCREQCNNSCSGGLGHMRCTQPDGSFTYDCNDPQNQANIAECQNVLEEEFAHVGIDPVGSGGIGAGDLASQSPVCGYADLDSGECRGSQYCKTHILYCDGQIAGQPEIGGNCNLVPGLCGVKADETGNLYVDRPACNPECGSDERCMDDGNGAGFCQANSINQPPVTVIDSQNNIRVEGTTLRIGEGAAGVSDCQNITSDLEKHNCLVEYAKSHIGDFTGQTVAPQPSPQSDTTCQTQTPSENYCDGNVCIEKSSGWDGSACVPVYRSVSNSNCNNACGGNSAQSGETVNLLNCLEANDDKSRADCKAENNRIIQTGQQIDPTSRIKASLSLENCSNFQDEAKQACENKNEETKFLGKVLDSIRLEDCASKNGDEKTACETQNLQTIRQGQVRLNLGVEDCSKLSGDQKINCEFTNYQRDQLAKISASFRPENCSEIKNEQEAERCNSENQRRYHDAISNASDFVGLAELGASCVYTEACQEGGKKACAGTVANDNGAPVCRYDPAAASCSACTTADLNLQNTENKCSEDGQTCLNGPGLACISDAQCQNRLAAAQQAAANAPIDPAKFFSQKFEEGATCLQPQTCDLGDGTQGEQVCYGKGSAEGKCDLSQGGGVCSACQAKGSIKLNREASCNAENKCVGAPALSGCMNDDQCKPVEVVTQRTGTVTNSVGAGQTVINNQIFDIEKVCTTERRRVNDYMNYQDAAAASGDEAFALQQSQNVSNSYEDYVVCAEKYTPTGRQAVATVVYYDRAVIQATNATNQLDSTHLGASALSGGTDDIMVSQVNASYLAKLEEQRRVLENLKQAESALAQIGYNSQLSTILDRSTDVQLNEGVRQQVAIEDQTLKAQQSLAAVAAARNSFNQNSIGNSADSETVAKTYDEFEKAREKAQSEISQLATLRRESSTGLSQQLQNQLDNLPTKADQQFKETQLQRESNQLANVARTSTSPDVVLSTEVAITRRADEADALGNKALADALAQQANQAGFSGWTNIYTNQLLQPGGDSEKANTNEAQQQIQRVIEQTQKTNPQLAQQLKNDYEAIPSYVTAIRLANEIKRETVGTFAGTVNQDNNSAFYSAIANAEEQAKSREDLANLVDRTCTLSAQRCTTLQNALGITNPNATPDQIADSVIGTSQSDGARAANLLVEQSRLLPQLYQVERAGDANNIDQLTSLLGRSNQIKAELAQIDPNLAVRAEAQVQEVIAQGKAQNQLDYAANTYANNKDLLLGWEKVKAGGITETLPGVQTAEQIASANERLQNAIAAMQQIDPQRAAAMQSDFDLTQFKLETLPQGSDFVGSDKCVIESCNGNGSTAQNICTGQVAKPKMFNAFCAAKNGNLDPGEAWKLSQESNRVSASESNAASVAQADTQITGIVNTIIQNPGAALALVNPLGVVATTNYLGYQFMTTPGAPQNAWNNTREIAENISSMISDWGPRSSESKIPVFLGDTDTQNACRALWQNSRVQGEQQIRRGESSLGCQIDNRSYDQRVSDSSSIVNTGGTVKDLFFSIEGVKAETGIRQRTIERAAEEAGVDINLPMLYWTETQKAKFQAKLASLDAGAGTDIVSAVLYPVTADNEARAAAVRCEADYGRDLCRLDPFIPDTYIGIAQSDSSKYQQTMANARKMAPGLGEVSQTDFAWVVERISDSKHVIGDITAKSNQTVKREDYATDEEYYDAIGRNLASTSKLNRDQLIDQLLLDANISGLSPDGQPKTREEIANIVDGYLAVGYYGNQVVANSSSYQWQQEAENQYNWEVAQIAAGLVTTAGPLEFLDPTNPIVNVAIKGITKTVSVPTRAVAGLYDNVLERIGTNTAKNVLEETYGLTRAESNAIASFYNGRIAEKSVAQSVAELTPAQQLAFGQATDKIGAKLGLTETPDHLIASTILDNILKPQVVNPSIIADRGRVIAALVQEADYNGNLTRDRFDQLVAARLIQPAEVEALAAKGVFDPLAITVWDSSAAEVLGRQVAQEVLTTQKVIPSVTVAPSAIDDLKTRAVAKIAGEPEARVRVVNGQVDGIRVGQATDEENRLIATILESDPAARTNAGQLVQQWNNLNPDEKELILDQVAREVAVNQAAVRELSARTPTSGNQALIQLAEQSKAVSAGNTSPALTNALTSASVVVPKVADVVVKIADGTPLNVLDRKALELAGVSESSLKKNIDPLSQTAKLKVAIAVTADPTILAKADLETTLLNQGMTSNQASMLATSLQPLAPTPPAPAAQPGFLARLADTFNTLTGRNTPPASQALPNTATVANNTTPNNQTPNQPITKAPNSVTNTNQFEIKSAGGKIDLKGEDVICSLSNPLNCVLADGVSSGGGGPAARAAVAKFEAGLNAISDTDPEIVKQKMIQLLRDTDIEAQTKGQGGTTTLVGVKVAGTAESPVAVVTGVGDSRVYLVRDGLIEPINTEDNWLLSLPEDKRAIIRYALEESRSDDPAELRAVISDYIRKNNISGQNIEDLTRRAATEWNRQNFVFESIGNGSIAKAGDNELAERITLIELKPGDRLLLTSDGVHDNLTRSQIEYILSSRQGDMLPSGRMATGNQVNDLLSESKAISNSNSPRAKPDDISAIIIDTQPSAANTAIANVANPAQPVNPASITTATPLTPANPTIPNAPSWVNRATYQVANWLQVAERPLNWLSDRLSGSSVTPKIITTPPLDQATAAQVVTRLTTDLPGLERQAALAAQNYQAKIVEQTLAEAEIQALEKRRSNWLARQFNRGSDLEIQLGIKKGQLDNIKKELSPLELAVKTANRDLERARIDLKEADKVINPQSASTQRNLRDTSNQQLTQRQKDLNQAKKELELTKNKQPQTAADKLKSAQEKLAGLQAQLARDGDNISGFTEDKQQNWLKAYEKVKQLEADSSTSKAVLDQAREDLRQARNGLTFRNVSEADFAEALANRNAARLELDQAFTAVNDITQDINRLTLDTQYYSSQVVETSQLVNQINDSNRRLLDALAPTDGFSEPRGFGFWKRPAEADVAYFMDSTGRLWIDDSGKQGIWVIAKYEKASDGTVTLDRLVVPHTAAQSLRDAARAATPGKWMPGKLSGDVQVVAESEFNKALNTAQRVNTQQLPIVVTPPAATRTAPTATAPTVSTIGSFNDLLAAPETFSAEQRVYYDDLQFEKYFEDAHTVLFHSTDPADVAKIKNELNLPQNYTEADYFRQLEDLRNQRLQSAASLGEADERAVRASLGEYLPRDVEPVSISTPVATVQTNDRVLTPRQYIQLDPATATYQTFIAENPEQIIDGMIPIETIEETADALITSNQTSTVYTIKAREKGGPSQDAMGVSRRGDGVINLVVADGVGQALVPDFTSRLATGRVLEALSNSTLSDDIFDYAWSLIQDPVHRQIGQSLIDSNPNLAPIIRGVLQEKIARNQIGATTLSVVQYAPSTGKVRYGAHGDSPIIIFRADGSAPQIIEGNINGQLGYAPGSRYNPNGLLSGEVTLRQGDVVLVMSDGTSEGRYPGLYQSIADQVRAGASEAEIGDFIASRIRTDGIKDDVSVGILKQKSAPVSEAVSPVQAVVEPIVSAVDDAASAVRAAGNGTPIQPVTDAAANLIESVSGVGDDINRVITGSPSTRDELIEQSRLLNERLTQLEAQERQLKREYDQLYQERDEIIDQSDRADLNTADQNQLSQELSELNAEMSRVYDEITAVQNEWFQAIDELDEINIRINESSFVDEVEDAINFPSGVAASRLEDLAGFARATGNTDLAESLKNAADAIRRSIQSSDEAAVTRRVLTEKEQDAIEYIFGSHRTIELDGRRMIYEWSEVTDQEIKEALIAVGLNENADLTASIRRVSQELNDPLLPIISNPVDYTPQVSEPVQVTQFVPPQVVPEQAFEDALDDLSGYARIFDGFTPNEIPEDTIREVLYKRGFTGTPEEWDEAVKRIDRQVNSPLLPILDNIDVPGTPLGTVAGAYRFTSALFDEADRLVNGVETPSAGRLPNAAPGTDITISQISESSRNWYRPTGGGGAGATTLINDDLGLVAKYAQSPDAIFNLQAELAVVDNSTGLFPKVINRVVNNRGEVVGYVMEKINGVPLSQYGVDNLPHAAKIALLYKLAQFYEEKGIPRMDVGINFGEHFWVETLPSGRVRVRSIDPLPRAVSNLGFYDEVRAIIDGVPLTDKQKIVLQAQIDLEVEKIIAKLGLPDDVAVKTIKEIIAENKMRALDAYSYSIGKSNTRPVIQTLDEMLQDAEYVEIFTDGRSSFRNAKNYGWDEPVSQSGQLCDLVSIPSQSTLAQANQATNVLGVSSGEVLAASTGPCGPFATAWLEMSKSQGGKVLDDMTAGKLFDTYTDIFVKMDASLPEPVLNMGNKVIGLFKKSTDNLDQVAKITPAPAVEEIPILKPLVEETPKFSKKLSADEQFISEYFDQIKTGQVADGQIMLYFDPNSGKIVTTNVSASDIVPFEIQIFRNADSSLDIASLKIPSDYAYGESLYSIINTLEKLTDSRVLHINETSKQKLFALEGTIPAIIQPDLVTMTSVLLTKPDVARLYANRQIEQNWLNKNLENLLGDNYINLRQKALPPPDPYLEVPKQLDTTYSQYKAGEINETQLIEQVESIAGIHSQSQKIQEIPLFIDERFLRTGLLAGRDLEDIKHWFGAGEWAGWLGARKVAQSYGDRPLSTSFIQNLHQALLIPASTKEDVLVGDFRLNAMFGFKKDNPGEFPISKIKVINENPYLKFIETPVPEGKMARPDETKWGYIQYPRVGDADFMNSLPEHIKAKLSPRPTNQELVQVLVEDVIDWYNTQSNLPGVDRVALAAELQRRLISVHPFGDANGRLSRIVMNWSLENAGYPAPRIVNFNADIETPLAQWIETVRNGISREQKVQEKLKLMEEIGWVDPVEALGYSELKTFYDLMAKNGKFANSSRLLPEVNGQIKRTPYGSLNDLNRDIVLAWNNFHKMFGGESQVLTDGTKITVGGLVPQSYIDLVRLKNPKNFEAYEKLIKDFYSNRDVTVYRGMHFSIPADTPKRVAALFETPRPAWNSYYSHTFSSPKSPRFLRLDTPNMSSSDVIKESLVKGLEEYNRTVIDDYTDILDDETIQMEDKIDSLRRKIKIHAIGDSTNTEVSPFVSLSTNRGIADGFAGGSYKNPFFNQYSGKPNKRQAGILVTAKLPAQGVIPTFNTGYQTFGFDGVPPQIIPGIGGQLSVHTGEFEILVPGGINPAHIERIQVKVRTNDQTDPSWKSYKFDAVKSIKEDGIYVEVKEMVIGSDGYPTGEVKQTTHFKLNPSNGKYEEVSTINTVEDILNSIKNNPFLTGSTTTSFATP